MIKHTFQIETMIAHRGASAIAPENTLVALEKAVANGASCIEFDVMLTRDGVPVIMHDESVNRTTDGRGQVSALDYCDIAKLDAGSWFSQEYAGVAVPTLAQWLQTAAKLSCCLNIELKEKTKRARQLVGCVLWHLDRYWPTSLPVPLISSANRACLREMYRLNADLPLGLISHHWPWKPLTILRQLHCVSLNIYYKRLTETRVQKIKQAGYRVLAYTVNDPKIKQTLYDWGVDAVFSDCV